MGFNWEKAAQAEESARRETESDEVLAEVFATDGMKFLKNWDKADKLDEETLKSISELLRERGLYVLQSQENETEK